MWIVYACLAALFAALTAIFAKVGVKNIDADLATAIRTVIVLVLAWSIVAVKGSFHLISSLHKQNWIFLFLSGLATGLSWIFYFKALQSGPVSVVAPIDKLSVALTIFLAVIFLKEVVTLKTAIGALLIVAGTLVMVIK